MPGPVFQTFDNNPANRSIMFEHKAASPPFYADRVQRELPPPHNVSPIPHRYDTGVSLLAEQIIPEHRVVVPEHRVVVKEIDIKQSASYPAYKDHLE